MPAPESKGERRGPQRLKQWWRADLLAALADGHPLARAYEIADVAGPTVRRHRQRDPSLDKAIREALKPRPHASFPKGTSWHAAFLANLEQSGIIADALSHAGVSHPTMLAHRRADAEFDRHVQRILDHWAAHTDARWQNIGQRVADLVADGMSVKDAAVATGVDPMALSTRRKADPALDEKIKTARSTGSRTKHQQWLERWEEPFLAAVAAGQDLTSACISAGVHVVQMYRERRNNPAFEAKVRQTLIAVGKGFDSDARRMLLIRLHQGASLSEALASIGVTRQQLDEACASDARLAKKIRPYVSDGKHGRPYWAEKLKCPCRLCQDYRNAAEQKRRARRRLDRFPPQAREAFLALVRDGERVVDAARQTGVSWQTVYQVADDDPQFRARLDEATQANCICEGTGWRRDKPGGRRCECPTAREYRTNEARTYRERQRAYAHE